MAYAILRTQKYSSISAAMGSERHGLDRSKLKFLTHPENSHLNSYHFYRVFSDCKDLHEAFDLATQNVKRKIRENSVKIIEVIMAFSPEAEKQLDVKQWANTSMNWVRKFFGQDNLVSYRLDWDEKTPHIHCYVIPICRDSERGDRLCAKDFLGGREKMREMQTSYAKAVEGFGLERGKEGSKAFHQSQKVYWANLDFEEQLISDIMER